MTVRVLFTLALVLFAAPATHAATVSGKRSTQSFEDILVLVVELKVAAAPGETNDLRLQLVGDELVVTDVVKLTPEGECSARSDLEVRCPVATPEQSGDLDATLAVAAGDGADRVTLVPGMRSAV